MAIEHQPTSDQRAERQARDQRIAELRRKRRARMRKLAVRSSLGVLALVLVAAMGLYWLLNTGAGRQFLLAQIVARLPAGTSLTWDRAEGPAMGPLTLHGLRYEQQGCPDREGEPVPFGQCLKPQVLVFTARRAYVDPDIRPLLGKLLRLDALQIQDATLALPRSEEPFELPRWPESLPRIELPLDLQADNIQVDGFKVSQAGEPVIDVRSLRGGLDARDGNLEFEQLVIDSDRGYFTAHGSYNAGNRYATDLTLGAVLPAPTSRTRPRIGLVARGDLARMDLAISGNAPAPLQARLTIRGEENPRWSLKASSTELDLAALTNGDEAGTPLAFDIEANGIGGEARLQGELTRGDLVLVVQPSQLRVEDQVLELKPLVVDVFGGRVIARGRGDFNDPENATFKFAVGARGLAFGAPAADTTTTDPATAIGADADFGIAGTLKTWAATGKATVTRDDEQADIRFKGRGDSDKLALQALHVAMPTGTLDADGVVGWSPGLHWNIDADLAGFDPGYFASGWNGAVNGTLASKGRTRDDGGLEVDVDADRLGGKLRGRKLDGRASFTMHGAADGKSRTDYAGDIALTLGGSRIDAKGTVGNSWDVDARLSPLQLADLAPGGAGTLRGTLALGGARTAPVIQVDMTGSELEYNDYAAASLSANGRLPWQGGNGSLAIAVQGVEAGVSLDSVRIVATGAVENLQVDAQARGEIGSLDLAGSASKRGDRWQGTLASLRLAPAKGAAWQLQSPARFTQQGSKLDLSQSCFSSSQGGSLCASADWPARGLTVTGTGLPLALAEPYLPEPEGGGSWALLGEIALDAKLRPAGNAYAGEIELSSANGSLRTGKRARNSLIAYSNLNFDAEFDARDIQATLGTSLQGGGRIDASVDTGWDAYAPLSGQLTLDTEEITWLELFSPDIASPTGKVEGRITLGGTRAQPSLGGSARLSDFTAEVPPLGIVLQQGNVRLDAHGDGSADIDGSVQSGDGTLNIDGTLGWREGKPPLNLHVHGQDVLVSDTRNLQATASPDLTVRYSVGEPLEVTGKVLVPSAMIDLERLDQGVSASDDVVILDPVDPEHSDAATPLSLDLTLVMGDDVRLDGFGLDGTLSGQMRVSAVPGREMTAKGELDVGGKYSAYGQRLVITRGRLQWSNSPISDPRLDIRAERDIAASDITAGISVTGRASAPQASVWTDPSTDQSEALSYLTLGRSTSSLTGAEGEQLNAASAALNAGGNLLASRIGSSIGLDNAGITQSRALGGSVFGFGKQLSPRLYVGFGVSLLGTGQVLTLKYLLRKGFDLEIESSTQENRGSVNWRKEK